jgi:hypothetical protein
LVQILNQDKYLDIAPLSQIKIIAFKDKGEWDLQTKYNIGKKRTDFYD